MLASKFEHFSISLWIAFLLQEINIHVHVVKKVKNYSALLDNKSNLIAGSLINVCYELKIILLELVSRIKACYYDNCATT